MKNDDARKTPESLHERRKQVVRLHRKGYGPMKIAELTGLSWGAVNTALKLYKQGGTSALKPKRRGRKIGTERSLSIEQELADRGGKNAKRRAVVAVARKLAVLLHRLWIDKAAYDPFHQQTRKELTQAA